MIKEGLLSLSRSSLAETLVTAYRLARDLQKTQRRVNALEHIFIPQYIETADWIESALEEREREETFRLKVLKSRSGESNTAPREDKQAGRREAPHGRAALDAKGRPGEA